MARTCSICWSKIDHFSETTHLIEVVKEDWKVEKIPVCIRHIDLLSKFMKENGWKTEDN